MQGKRGFDRLLKRYLRDRVAGRDKDTFDAWLDTDKINTEEAFAWKADDERKLFERITGSIDRHARTDGWWMTMRLTNSLPVGQWIKMAATVLLILMASYGTWDLFKGTLRRSDRLAGCHLKKFPVSGECRDGRAEK
jgi:hypothetical protein